MVALWREALLAQAVLNGETKGYTRHPQLNRFREGAFSTGLIADYLRAVHAEATARGYRFQQGKIHASTAAARIELTRGQLEFEWRHLMEKLRQRDPERLARQSGLTRIAPHPLFRLVPGPVADWERVVTPG